MISLFFLSLLCIRAFSACTEVEVPVSTPEALQGALDNASAGHVIQLSNASFRSSFIIKDKKGRQSCPIKITGAGDGSVIEGEKLHFCLSVVGCQHVEISRIAFRSCDSGVYISKSSAIMADTLWIQYIHRAGIRICDNSSSCQISRCRISNTGTTYSEWGHAITIGRPQYDFNDGETNPHEEHTKDLDQCKNNKIIGNKIGPNVPAPAIVIYKGSESNNVYANQIGYLPNWMRIYGNNNTVKKNYFTVGDEDNASVIAIYYTTDGHGIGNTIEDNDLKVDKSSDYAISVDERIPKNANNVCKNSVSDALIGVSKWC